MDDFEETAWTRRRVLVGGALAGGVAWAAPAISTIGGSAFAQTGSPADTNISFIALLLDCGGTTYRIKFENNDDGTFSQETGRDFSVPCADDNLEQGSTNVSQDAPPGTFTAVLNSDGSVTITASGNTCTITDFQVKCGTNCEGPGEGAQQSETTFPVTFEQCATNQGTDP